MSTCTCPTCGNPYSWDWEEAFVKFGFGDGEGLVMTEHVAAKLRQAGYAVTIEPWGCHNVTIASIKRDGVELIPFDSINFGYDDPRDYLPAEIIDLLDDAFDEDTEVHS